MQKKAISGEVASWMDGIHRSVQTDYEKQNRILSFDEYLELLKDHPEKQIRSSPQYISDMMDHFGREGNHFRVFDQNFVDGRFRLVGQEHVQENIYSILQSFVREGSSNKLILLHGPNGSAKTSIIACLTRGLEHYSHLPEGALYRFHWIFPSDRYGKGGLGLGGSKEEDSTQSFAKLPDSDVAARISCELRDHPLFLIPGPEREKLLKSLPLPEKFQISEYVKKGDLSQKSQRIFEALLRSYKGDYKKVLRHIQVERFYVSRRYREASASVEPQMHVDATIRQITIDRSASMLPSSLQFLSLFDLDGDLVDGNRGIIEYNDLLKRPIDAFKYLLSTTETGTVNVGGAVAFLDCVMIGTCNEAQLDAFKEYPDFPSFKARIELVRVPYLLNYKREEEIYQTQIDRVAGTHHVAPHVLECASRWAVLSRLKKPNASHYASNLAYLINSLTPWEKARFYATDNPPARLSADEKRLLKAQSQEVHKEYSSVPYYEGRVGPSPREMKIILFNALERNKHKILSPLGLFSELEEFIKRTSEYDYLREDVVEGYHDCRNFINTIRDQYLDDLDSEVRSCLGVHDDSQYESFLKKYVTNVTSFLKKEKIKNPVSGKSEEPDKYLMEEFEKVTGVTSDQEPFRQNILTTLGVYSLEHPEGKGALMNYADVFPDLMKKIRDFYIDEHSTLMKRVHDAITFSERRENGTDSDAEKLAHTMLSKMQTKYGYIDVSAKEAFIYLVQKRY